MKRSSKLKSIIAGVCVILVGWSGLVRSAEFNQSVEECPTNRGIIGYTSLEKINADIEAESKFITNGGSPRRPYLFLLCPNSRYDASIITLNPSLGGSIFMCGENGYVADSCEIYGGSNQVIINESSISNYVIDQIDFIGITFAGFSLSAISGNAGSNTTVELRDARFQV